MPKAASGSSGTSAPPMITSPTRKTPTPATAESPASSRIDASTIGVSLTPKRRKRDDARRRRPDASGDVLREHREHLGLQRDAIRDPDPVRGEDPHPAEHEDEVVDGDDRGRDHDVADVRVAQQRLGVGPHVAQRPRERGEQHREPDQLEGHVDALVAEQPDGAAVEELAHSFSLRAGGGITS